MGEDVLNLPRAQRFVHDHGDGAGGGGGEECCRGVDPALEK